MPGSTGHPIVETAITLLMEFPNLPALEILDRAMEGHAGSDPDFEAADVVAAAYPHPAYDDELDPPSPFAELLRRAFAPQLDPREVALLAVRDRDVVESPEMSERITKMQEVWQDVVIERFARRYRLWSA